MYERFTDRARRAMQLANAIAIRWNHEYIGTEHVAAGVVEEGGGLATLMLAAIDVKPDRVIQEIRKLVQSGPVILTAGKLAQTPRVPMMLQLAVEEAREMNRNYVGTEHLLIALMKETEGCAFQGLYNAGVKDANQLRDALENLELGALRNEKVPAPADGDSKWTVDATAFENPAKELTATESLKSLTEVVRLVIASMNRMSESIDRSTKMTEENSVALLELAHRANGLTEGDQEQERDNA